MTARAFRDGIATLLVSDGIFASAITALIGTSVATVLTANTPAQEVTRNLLPCFVIEQSGGVASPISNDGDDFLTIGSYEQHTESDLSVALWWHEPDREKAADARSDLSTLFAQLLLRNPTPGGIYSAWLQEWATDAGTQHPNHIFVATLRGQYAIPRS